MRRILRLPEDWGQGSRLVREALSKYDSRRSMAYCRTHTLARPAREVFSAATAAASGLGFFISQSDRESGHIYMDQPGRLGRPGPRFSVSVTDSGLGSTVLHVAWQSNNALPWPLRREDRNAARFCRQTERALAAGRFREAPV